MSDTQEMNSPDQRVHQETADFDRWFHAWRERDFNRKYGHLGDRFEDHLSWALGLRSVMLQGWLARAGCAP